MRETKDKSDVQTFIRVQLNMCQKPNIPGSMTFLQKNQFKFTFFQYLIKIDKRYLEFKSYRSLLELNLKPSGSSCTSDAHDRLSSC